MNKILSFITENLNFDREFPVGSCNIPHTTERGVFDSEVWYYCLIIDDRFDNEIVIKKMKPYVYVKNDSYADIQTMYFGWVDEYGNIVTSCYNSVHPDDDDKVFGWIKIEND